MWGPSVSCLALPEWHPPGFSDPFLFSYWRSSVGKIFPFIRFLIFFFVLKNFIHINNEIQAYLFSISPSSPFINPPTFFFCFYDSPLSSVSVVHTCMGAEHPLPEGRLISGHILKEELILPPSGAINCRYLFSKE